MDLRVLMVVLLPLCCSEPDQFRLVGGTGRCEGRVEMKREGHEWKHLFAHTRHMMVVNRLCSELNCGTALSVRDHTGTVKPTWFISTSHCTRTPTLSECIGFNLAHVKSHTTLELKCSDSVRLVDGPRLCSGSLKVFWERSWTSVCEEDFDLQDAQVVCRELGCGPPSVPQGALSTEGQTFRCEGHESALMSCPRNKSPAKNCTSARAVNLTCSDPVEVRLIGQPSRCGGTVEVKLQDEWRRMSYSQDLQLKPTADVLCRELKCGPAVIVRGEGQYPRSAVWPLSGGCFNQSSALRDCVDLTDPIPSASGIELVCADVLERPSITLTGVFQAHPQGFRVPTGSDFWVKCTAFPQYQGGSFQLFYPFERTTIQPAVNHVTNFQFTDAGPAHTGNYTCVYHHMYQNHHVYSYSQPLYFSVGN